MVYLYNCTNNKDVVFRGEIPIMEELGPFAFEDITEYKIVNNSMDPLPGAPLNSPKYETIEATVSR